MKHNVQDEEMNNIHGGDTPVLAPIPMGTPTSSGPIDTSGMPNISMPPIPRTKCTDIPWDMPMGCE